MAVRTGFWSSSVAHDWEHGLVAGTGSIGAVLHGEPERHAIHVSHEEFFLPVNSAIPAPRIADRIDDVRAAAVRGDADAAAELTRELALADGYPDGMVWTDPFVPIAELTWTPDHPTDGTGYRREGDFATGRVAASWGAGDAIALVPDRATGTLALELRAEHGADGVLGLGLGTESHAVGEFPAIDYTPYLLPSRPTFDAGRFTFDVRLDEEALPPLVREHPASPWAPRRARLTIEVPADVEAELGADGLRLRLRAGVAVSLPIGIELSGGRVGVAPADGTSHADLVAASSLELHSGIDDATSYDEVLERARRGDPPAVLAALELAYAAGRHTIISSTGVLPPTLVGIWQGTRRPAWSGDWTQNGNVQHGGVASLVASGTPELFTSYLQAIFRHTDDYASNAQRIFGADGWMLPARFDSHGHANHFSTMWPHLYWMAGGAWVLRLAWDHFAATGDVEKLRAYAWPLAQHVMAFAMSVARPGEDGLLHLAPSYSPENTPANRPNPIAADATMDVAAFRDAARLAERIADVLDEPADRTAWRAFAERLPSYRVADDGTFAEWLDPTVQEELGHRHVSQLYPFWYETDVAADTPELRAAALQTIHRKLAWRDEKPWAAGDGGRMEMAFGLVGLGLAAARLGDAEAARRCVEQLATGFWRPNAVSTHDGDAIFNVDASGGLPALVIEMLVQSEPGRIRVLPALPASWRSGAIRGVRARGGIIVEALGWDADGVSVVLALAPDSAAARDGDRVTVVAPDGSTHDLDLSDGRAALRLGRVSDADGTIESAGPTNTEPGENH